MNIDPSCIRDENEALDQSIALNRIVLTVLQQQKENNKRLFICLAISLLINLCVIVGGLLFLSQYDFETTVSEETITQETDGDSSIINGNQYNDSAVHSEGGSTE